MKKYDCSTSIEGRREELREKLARLPRGLKEANLNMNPGTEHDYDDYIKFFREGFRDTYCGVCYIPASPVIQYCCAKDGGFVSIMFAEEFGQWIAINDHTKRVSRRDEDGEPIGGTGFGPTEIYGPARLTKEICKLIGEAYDLNLEGMSIEEISKLQPSKLEEMAESLK